MRRRLLALFLVACAPLAVVAACSHEQSIDDWISKADAICRQAQDSADADPAPQSPLPGEKLRLTASRTRDEVASLRKLDSPSEQGSAVAEYLITLDHRNEALENYAEALDKAPTQGPPPPRNVLEDVTTQAYTQAAALGLNDCNGGVDFAADTTTTTLVPPPDTAPAPTVPGGTSTDSEDGTQDQPG